MSEANKSFFIGTGALQEAVKVVQGMLLAKNNYLFFKQFGESRTEYRDEERTTKRVPKWLMTT
jgi:hypothetical protein